MKNIFVPQNNYGQEAEIQQGGEEPLLFSGNGGFVLIKLHPVGNFAGCRCKRLSPETSQQNHEAYD